MAAAPTSSIPLSVVLDASFIIGYCAREPAKYAKAQAELDRYTNDRASFFAPGVAIAECLFVFCKQLKDGLLTTTEHAQAVQSLEALMRAVGPPPNGEYSLISRAEKIRGSYSCRHSNDCLYLALTDQLSSGGAAELVTFDSDMKSLAQANVPALNVNLLAP
jgi:predicted nucleic acid-binding protein